MNLVSPRYGLYGGFFPSSGGFRENVSIYSPPAHFFKVEISSLTLIPLFRPGSVHSGFAS